VHDLALTQTEGALIQVAISSHPNEREVGASASRAPHVWRQRVEQHGKFWHPLHSSAAGSSVWKLSRHSFNDAGFSRHPGQHFLQK
jgi:hypothetical protein